MKMKSMITGVSMATAAGTVAYAVTEATSSEKKMLKAAQDVLSELSVT